jgi:hypothetical protein
MPSPAQFCTRCGMTMAAALPPIPPPQPAMGGYRAPMQPNFTSNYYGPSYMRTRRPGGIFVTILLIFFFLHGLRACSSIVPVMHLVNSPTQVFPSPPQTFFQYSQQQQNSWQGYQRH